MVTIASSATAGYRLERVYVAEQRCRLVQLTAEQVESAPGDRPVRFAWDWRPVGTRRFEVVLEVAVDAAAQVAEEALVRIVGLFEAEGEGVSVTFYDFVRYNASAILIPFAREAISTMTARGFYGTFHVNPVNVVELFKNFDISKTTGARYLNANPAIAADFGLEYSRPPAIAAADAGEKP